MESTEEIDNGEQSVGFIQTNRELTVSLIGSIIRFTIDISQIFQRREEIAADKLLFLLLPIVRNLGKLIERIKCSASSSATVAPNGTGMSSSSVHYHLRKTSNNSTNNQTRADDGADNRKIQPTTATGGHPKKTCSSSPQFQRQRSSVTPLLMSDDAETARFKLYSGVPANTTVAPHRQLFQLRDGNYAIRETTDNQNIDGSVQRITRTIIGPDIAVLTSATSQLPELPSLTAGLSK
ncbi:hypothetical protein ZHAS_00018589 [Anopheles sinensis]|uniref:Uncharacterized protein n=1 Tax=Anopheles sinensis TaxID=74873 RepID=A0A084WJC7_ANOSI|nr:hypothetical protein ZHAS_00018589 [Anopheles sinensis]